MKNILEEYAIELLAWLEDAAAWTQEQVPLFVEELLAWGLWKNVALGSLYFILVPSLLLGGFKLWKLGEEIIEEKGSRYARSHEEFYQIFSVLFWTTAFILLFPTIIHLVRVIKVLVAPRLYLIETVSSFLSSGS